MAEKVNPYIAGAPVVESSLFFGRDDVFSWITRALMGKYVDHILVIHGQRRVGKTSVLKQLSKRLPENYIQVFLDLQGRISISIDRFLWWMAREITKSLRSHEIDLATPNLEAFSQDLDYFESKFLPQLTQALGEKKLLLTFDEFDTLDSPTAREGLALPLLTTLQHLMDHGKMAFIFSIGSSGRKLENMQAAYTDFFKQGLYKKISYLNEDDAKSLITKPVAGVLEYTPDAISMIYQITSGHPYYIQLICHELFSTCQKVDRWVVSRKNVEDVLDQVIERGTVNLKYIWDEAPLLGKWILGFLAQAEPCLNEEGLCTALNQERVHFSRSDLTSELLRLQEKDILTQDNRFVVQLMRLWMQRNRPIERVREELVETNPIANRFIEIGEEYKDQNEYLLAIENFNKALAVDPENLRAWVNLGFTALTQQLYEQAAQNFEKALAMDEEDVLARNGMCQVNLALGVAAQSKGEIKNAAAYYHQVLKLDSEHEEARQRLRNLDQARENYTQAELALKSKDYARAISLLKEVILVSESYKNTSNLLAQAVVAQRRHRPAWLNWRLVISIFGLGAIILTAWLVTTNLDSIRSMVSQIPSFVQVFASNPDRLQSTKTAPAVPSIQPTPIPPNPPWFDSTAKLLLEWIATKQPDLTEDFSAPNIAWTQFDPNLSIVDGVLEYQGTGAWLVPEDFYQVQDFVLQFDLISNSPGDLPELSIHFRGSDEDDRTVTQGNYIFYLRRFSSYSAFAIGLGRLDSAGEFPLYEGTAPRSEPGKAVQIMLMVENNHMMLFLDGKPITYQEDDTWDAGWMRIFLGFPEVKPLGHLQIDNLKYWSLEPTWMKNFVKPVLQSIEGQLPDFEDDFSKTGPGWEQAFEAGAQIADGVLSYTGHEVNFQLDRQLIGRDFILQYTFTPRSENQSQFFYMNFRISNTLGFFYNYGLNFGNPVFDYNNRWGISKILGNSGGAPTDITDLSNGEVSRFVTGRPTVVTLIAQGDQFGILLDGRPAGYAQDDRIMGNSIGLHFGSNDEQNPIWVEIDDLKFWNLDPIEEKEFANPILLMLNNNSPLTFWDDFSEVLADWGRLPDGVSIADGVMVMDTSDEQDVMLASNLFTALDFYIRILFSVAYSGEEPQIILGFRGTDRGYKFEFRPDTYEWVIYKSEEMFLHGKALGYLPGKTNELICLAQGDQFAIYMNSYPLTLFSDDAYSGNGNQIRIDIKSGTVKLFIDEINFLDLSTIQLP